MAEKKNKVKDTDTPLKSLFIRRTAGGIDDILVYTEDLKADKQVKGTPATYFRQGRLFAYHWICEENDDTYKALWKYLGLTDADEKKEKRIRRTKKEMEKIREA